MLKRVLYILLLSCITIYPQIATNVTFISQGFSLQSLNPFGTSNIKNEVSNIGAVNPASINQFKSTSIGISYLFQTKQNEAYIAGIGYSRISSFIPQSFGIIFPLDELNFGLGMKQSYNGELDLGNIPVTTSDQPDGTGQFYHPLYKTNVNSYSLTASYSFSKMKEKDNELAAGFRLDYNRIRQEEKLLDLSSKVEDYSFSWGSGLTYNLIISNNQNITFGLAYESKIEFRKIYSFNSSGNVFSSSARRSDSTYFIVVPADLILAADIPGELMFDFSFEDSSKFNLLAGFNYIFWNSFAENIKNQFEFSGSIIYYVNNLFAASGGFLFSTGRQLKQDFFGTNGNTFFLTAGLKINLDNFDIDFSIADSHLLSGKLYSQTIGKISAGFSFQ
jgi:hypothetical protein